MQPFLSLDPDAGVAFLLALALKGSLVFSLAFVVTALLRRSSAAVRHAVWTLALGAALALPLLSVVVPGWQVAVLPGAAPQPLAVAPAPPAPPVAPAAPAPSVAPTAPAPVSSAQAERPAGGLGAIGERVSSQVERVGGPMGLARAAQEFVVGQLPPALRSWPVWLLLAWAAGVAFFAMRWVCAVVGAWRIVEDAEPVHDLNWLDLKERVAYDLGLDQPVRLLRSERFGVPVAGGVFDPVVVLPADADEWPEARREVVLTHELAHIARRDGLTQSLAQGALALHWFNPLAHLAHREYLLEREHACDDYVLDHGTRASDYAEHLIQIARRFRRETLALYATAPMARRSNLEDRITSILNPDRRRGTLGRGALVAASALMLTFVLPLAAFQPVEKPADRVAFTVVNPAGVEVHRAPVPASSLSSDETFEWEGRVGAGGFVEVHGVNGAIRARTGAGDRVRVEATKKSDRGREGEVEIVVNEVSGGVVVCAKYPGQRGTCAPGEGLRGDVRDSDVQVTFEAVLPENVRFIGQTVNGAVKTEPLGADVTARTVNGSIRTASRRGSVDAQTVNGSVEAEAAGTVRATTVNGSIDARLGRADWRGGLAFKTVNGSITLDLPASLSTTVAARAQTGSIHSDFPLRIDRTGFGGVTAEGTIGSGGRHLDLEVLNGSIRLQRAGSAVGSRMHRADLDRLRADQVRLREVHRTAIRQIHLDTLHVARLAEEQARLAMLQAEQMLRNLDLSAVTFALSDAERAEVEADIEEAMADLRIELAELDKVNAEEIEAALRDAEIELRDAEIEIEAALREAEREIERAIRDAERERRYGD